MDPNLTERQREILDYIQAYQSDAGFFPTLREMAAHFQVSIGTVQTHLDYLKRKGALDWEKGRPRALKIAEQYRSEDGSNAARELASLLESLVKVPVYRAVSAGPGVLAGEDLAEDVLTLPRTFTRHAPGEVFGIKVKGDSMIGAGILEGDLVLVRRQNTAQDGDIVVSLLGDEATVKHYRRRPDGTYLVSANPAYPPRKVGDDFSILGKVVSLMRHY